MENQSSAWQGQLEELTVKFRQTFDALSPSELYAKPNPDTWSIAENILHLIRVNSSYFPIFQQLLDKTYRPAWSGKFEFIYKRIGKAIYNSVSEGRKKKIKTFKTWEPQSTDANSDILKEFEAHQQELLQWLGKLEPFFGKDVVINSPVNKIISYTIDDAFNIIVAHEDRHFHQAKEVMEAQTQQKNLQA